MAKKSTTTKTKTKTGVKTTVVKDATARSVLSVKWSGTEYEQRKRWWWFLGLVLFAGWLTTLLILLELWTTAVLVIVITIAYFVVFTRRPKTWHYSLNPEVLMIDKARYPLERYRAFTITETIPTRKRATHLTIVLLPAARFGRALDLYLPENGDQDPSIIDGLTQVLPYDEAPGYQVTERVLSRMARWLKLS